MAKFDAIFKGETKKAELHPARVTKWIHYSKLRESKYQYRKGKTPEEAKLTRAREEALADLIDADGEVLQDLLVRKIDTDEYEIVAGGHRWGACKILAEERGKEKFAFLPCIVRNTSEVRTRFSVYSSNFGNKTQYEIMCELEGMKHLLETYPEEFPDLQTGRMVEKLEKKSGLDQTTVGEYLTISKNLGEKGMEKFERGVLKKSAAVELAGLSKEEQEELLDKGIISHKEIKEYKKGRKNTKETPEKQKEPDSPKSVPDFGTSRFPVMNNDAEREKWVLGYKTWPVWCKNEMTEETFYRYGLPDGSAIVVKSYPYLDYLDKKTTKEGQTLYLLMPGTKYFKNGETCMTEIIKYLEKVGETCYEKIKQ